MRSRELLAQLGRAAALLSVGAALAATSLPLCPGPPATTARFAVASSCGPSGESDAWYEGDDVQDCDVHDEMSFPGGPALGLPDGGLLDVPEGDWPADYEGDVLREGRFVLLGPVTVLGTSTVVHRTCRLTAAAPGEFDLACQGPEPEAACAGTLTLAEPAP